jgi:hypothetical protein
MSKRSKILFGIIICLSISPVLLKSQILQTDAIKQVLEITNLQYPEYGLVDKITNLEIPDTLPPVPTYSIKCFGIWSVQ